MRLHKTSRDFKILFETSKDFTRLRKTSKDFTLCQDTSEGFERLLKFSRDFGTSSDFNPKSPLFPPRVSPGSVVSNRLRKEQAEGVPMLYEHNTILPCFFYFYLCQIVGLWAAKIKLPGEIFGKNFFGGEIFNFLEDSAPLLISFEARQNSFIWTHRTMSNYYVSI